VIAVTVAGAMRDHAENPYQLLGVPACASMLEIRRAYRRLARRHHPDHNPDPRSRERFHALTEAYAALRSSGQRDGADANVPRPSHAQRPVGATLELSWQEAQLAATGPLRLVGDDGLTIALPAGIRDGDQLVLTILDRVITLTVRVQA
jgi:hypothetical protein